MKTYKFIVPVTLMHRKTKAEGFKLSGTHTPPFWFERISVSVVSHHESLDDQDRDNIQVQLLRRYPDATISMNIPHKGSLIRDETPIPYPPLPLRGGCKQ